MASLGKALFPRSTELANLPPYHPRALIGAGFDIASAPGRAYASLGRPSAESFSDAMARTGPTGAMPGPMYQSEGDEFADMVLRDPFLPLGAALSALAPVRALGQSGRAAVEGAINAAGSIGDQYATQGRAELAPALLSGLAGVAVSARPSLTSRTQNMSMHETLRKYGIDPDKGVSLYHGSPSSFEKFDLSRAGSQRAMTEGWGAYFTADKNNARAFGKNIIELQLSPDDLSRVIDLNAPMVSQSPYIRDALSSLSQTMQDPEDVMFRIQTMARDPLYKSNFRGEIGGAIWDYDKLRSLALSDKYVSTPVGNLLKPYFSPQEVYGSTLVKRAQGAMSGSSRAGNKLLNDYGVIGYSMPSSNDILAKNKNTVNAVIFDQDVLNRFSGAKGRQPLRSPLQSIGSRLSAQAKHAALREYLSDDRPQGDTPYTRSRR